jgi:hypothetical protein
LGSPCHRSHRAHSCRTRPPPSSSSPAACTRMRNGHHHSQPGDRLKINAQNCRFQPRSLFHCSICLQSHRAQCDARAPASPAHIRSLSLRRLMVPVCVVLLLLLYTGTAHCRAPCPPGESLGSPACRSGTLVLP